MTKVGELPIGRSDGGVDYIDLYEPGTFDNEPVRIALSDGRVGVPSLRPVGEGDTGLHVANSVGEILQANKKGILTIEDWESGNKSNWGFDGGGTVTSTRSYEGTYSYRGDTNGGIQRVRDNQRDHGTLPYYQGVGDEVRTFAWYGAAEDSGLANTFIRWGFGGIYEDNTDGSYYAQWDISNSSLRLFDSDGHNSLGVTFNIGYPGNEWWALEVDWQDPTITLRLKDYSNPDAPTTEATLSVDDTRYNGNTYLGHQWYVWNETSNAMYVDHAAILPA